MPRQQLLPLIEGDCRQILLPLLGGFHSQNVGHGRFRNVGESLVIYRRHPAEQGDGPLVFVSGSQDAGLVERLLQFPLLLFALSVNLRAAVPTKLLGRGEFSSTGRTLFPQRLPASAAEAALRGVFVLAVP